LIGYFLKKLKGHHGFSQKFIESPIVASQARDIIADIFFHFQLLMPPLKHFEILAVVHSDS